MAVNGKEDVEKNGKEGAGECRGRVKLIKKETES